MSLDTPNTAPISNEDLPQNLSAMAPESPPVAPDIFGTFFVGESEFAVSVEAIQEVVNEPEEFADIPLSPDYLIGLFNLRGVIIPVVDLHTIFGSASEAPEMERKIAIIEHGEHCFGLLVDRTGDVFNTRDAEQSLFSRVQGDLRETIVSGVFKLDDGARLVQILDPFELLNLERLPRVTGGLRSGLSRRKRGPRHQCISFKVGTATCAFDMDSIKEIVELEKIDDTTLASEWTLGAIDLRGNTVPVIDFRVYLSNVDAEPVESLIERNCKLIVMKMGDNLISLLVDEIENIISYYDDDLLPFPSVGLHRGEMFKGCLGNDDDKMVLLLDHQLVFSDEQVAQVTRGHSALFHEKTEAKETHSKNKRNRRTLITFRINANFALDIENVSEVIGFPDAVMEPPNLPDYIEGMVNLRGALIPIINLRLLYGLPSVSREQTKLLIFAQGDQKYAIMVDAVESIINVDDSNSGLLPRLSNAASEDGISKDVKEAILLQDGTAEQSSLMVLDLAAVAARVGGLATLAG
ncbi:MAG: chemotaxis protein CheW [Pseudomonadota bacterium]